MSRKKKDVAMAAANDKTGQEAGEHVGKSVGKVMDGIKEKAKKAKKMPSVVHTSERRVVPVKYKFTADEHKAIAKRLADRQLDLVQIEEEKKSVMANYTDKIKATKLDLSKLSRSYRDGHELREHDCFVVYDYKKREKRFKDVATKKIVETAPFGPGDDQRRLPI